MEKQDKIQRYLLQHLFECLFEIFGPDARHADKALEKSFRNHKKWGARDRRFFAENLYDIVRWWRRLTFFAKLEALEVSSWTEEEWYRLWDTHERFRAGELKLMDKSRAVRESVPDWLDQLGQAELGPRWDAILHSLNTQAGADLRVNLSLGSREELQKKLLDEGIETDLIPQSNCGLSLRKRKNVFITKAYREGLFEMQDRSSQRVVELLAPRPGDRVIDACAGAGGKTLHMGDFMKNRGQIIALDINERKLSELRLRARRAKVSCIETRTIDSTKVIKRLEAGSQALLLDVPCSGLGVLRRNPDTKWKLKPEQLPEIRKRQDEILDSYSRMLKPGGFMVYSTCSILPSENEGRIERFVSTHPGWKVLEQLRIDPDQGPGDGFFAAKLQAPL